MPETDDLSLLIAAAQAAGDLALRYTGPKARKWDKPDGAGPVTEADLAVNDLLEQTLRTARPDYGWLSEESTDDPDRLTRSRCFVVDPIDGTRSFAEGSRTWAHAIAVVEDGRPVAGVVFLPMRDLLYHAASGAGAFLNGQALTATTAQGPEGATVLAAKPAMDPARWRAGAVPGFARAYRPSLAYRMAVVAQGRFDAMITLRPTWDWDIAAGDVILREAGAATSDRNGTPLRFNTPTAQSDGVLAGAPGLHAGLIAALDHKAPAA
ncbi:MAG: 3'(2'),5'-bisphosphate nucleotidase CysQ [Marinibacterium sp.]|nr:3'(2'),5'-bisphosphate nucleotidase CysQ [Marinibacterium sp.]